MEFLIKKLKESVDVKELLEEITIALTISIVLICLQISGHWRYHEMNYEYLWHKLVISNVKAIPGTTEAKETFAKNTDMLIKLQKEKWEQLNVEERLDVMQVLVNVEASAMNIPHRVIVCAQELKDEGILAAYIPEITTIIIKRDHLEYDGSEKVVKSICHEMRHCLQYKHTLAFKALPKLDQELNQYEPEGIIANELYNYNDIDESLFNKEYYYGLLCEIEARTYAKYTVTDYLKSIHALGRKEL